MLGSFGGASRQGPLRGALHAAPGKQSSQSPAVRSRRTCHGPTRDLAGVGLETGVQAVSIPDDERDALVESLVYGAGIGRDRPGDFEIQDLLRLLQRDVRVLLVPADHEPE